MRKLNKVLLIDDSESTNLYNKSFLNEMDVAEQIDLVNSGQAALNYLKGKGQSQPPQPELIFLDLNMPDMSGFDFLEAYSKLRGECTNQWETVITVVSDYLDEENFNKCKEFKSIGVLEYIRKPLHREDIEMLFDDYFD